MNESEAELISKSRGMAFSEFSDHLAFPSLCALTYYVISMHRSLHILKQFDLYAGHQYCY